MKKIFKILMLLTFIPFLKVNAITVPVTISPSTDYGGNVYWFGRYDQVGDTKAFRFGGSKTEIVNGVKYGIYHVPGKAYTGSYNGKPFNTVCIDPGASEGGSNYTCQSLNSPALEEALRNKAQYDSGVAYLLAVRFIAAEEGLSSNTKVSSMYWYKISHDKSMFAEGAPSTLHMGQGGSTITAATNLATKIRQAAASKPNTGGATTFSYKHVSGSGNVHTFEITSTNALMEVPTVECVSGCQKISNVNWPVGSKTGTIVAEMDTSGNNCKMSVKIKYKANGEDGGLFLCSAGSGSGDYVAGASASSEQKMVAYITNDALSAAGGTKNSVPGNNNANSSEQVINLEIPDCENKCKDCDIKTNIDYSVNLCCEGDNGTPTISYAYEPKINEIFCTLKKDCNTTEDIIVPGANSTKSGNYLAKKVNDYCNIYCTEKVNVQVPNHLNGKNGKYFKLKGTSVDGYSSEGPIIWGNYACRNIIRYDYWVKDYVELAETVATKYNDYQEAQTISDLYDIAYEDGQSGNNSYSVGLSYSGTCYTTIKNQNLNCTGHASDSCSAPFTYDKYIPNRSANYQTAKIKYGDNKKTAAGFYELESVAGGNKSASVNGGYYNIHYTYGDDTYHCQSIPSSKQVSCNVSYWTGEYYPNGYPEYKDQTIYCDGSFRGANTSNKPTDINIGKAWDNARTSAHNKATQAKTGYTSSVTDLENKRKDITTCDDYFYVHSDDSFVKEKIQAADVSFNWFFVYISVNNYVQPTNYTPINYKGNCDFVTRPEYNGNYDTEGRGLESPHTDTKNPHTIATLNIFDSSKNDNIKCNNDSRKCSGGISENKIKDLRTIKRQSQKYTSDTLYKYYCTYKRADQKTNKFTVYPYGGYYTYSSENANTFAAHQDELYVEYSVLYGQYQTFWRFTQIGSKNLNGTGGKFDAYFKSGTDCAKNGVSGSTMDYYCKLNVKSSLSKIQGCDIGKLVTMNQGGNYWSTLCCKGTCKSNIEDTLTFAFKIVDPTNIFPGSKDDNTPPTGTTSKGSGSYAQNWFRTSKEINIKKQIQKESANDKLYDPSRITYQFQLNAKALRTIKEYNAKKNDYNSMDGKFKETDSSTGALRVYNSTFITNYYDGKIVMPGGSTENLGIDKLGNKALETARNRIHYE